MSIRDSMSNPRMIRDINCGILDGLRLGHGLSLGRVLVVESNPAIRALLTGTLRRAGYRVSAASNLDESLRRGIDDRPELILVDIVLADRDGLGVIAALRAQIDGAKIVAYCGDDRFARHLQAAISFGADDLLDTPSNPVKLLRVVRDLLELPDDGGVARQRPLHRAAG